MSTFPTQCLYERERCCSPETVFPIRSNRSIGAVTFAPIREKVIARPKLGALSSDYWDSRLQTVQALSPDYATQLLEHDSNNTMISKKRRIDVIPLLRCESTLRAVRRKADDHVVASSEMRILPHPILSPAIKVCD